MAEVQEDRQELIEESLAMLSGTLAASYSTIKACSERVWETWVEEAAAQNHFDACRLQIIFNNRDNPKALGANEEAREATIKTQLIAEAHTLSMAVAASAFAKHQLALAQLDVDQSRAQLRIIETIAAVSLRSK